MGDSVVGLLHPTTMPESTLFTLLSCHGLEDFPTHYTGDQANSLLASLTALWHPAILARAQSLPRWSRIDQAPADCGRAILIAPSIVSSQLPTGFAERVAQQKGLLVKDAVDRQSIVSQVLQHWGEAAIVADPENLADDFHALGYVYWQVQLMTRQLRYSSHLDEVHFQNLVVGAAGAFVSKQWTDCRNGLQSAFDLLLQERNRYFPVDALLIDLVLIAKTTLGESLTKTLQAPTPLNLLLTGELAARIAKEQPDLAAQLRQRIANATVEVVGGPAAEPRFALMSIESVLREFHCGHASYNESLGCRPRFFGRRRFGITSIVPQLLSDLGYRGALHASFDQGKFPPAVAGSIEWQAPDGNTIPAIAVAPIDAAQPDAFSRLGVNVGESFDSTHGATVLFAHWPAKTCVWFDDLMRSMKYAAVLGRFVTLHEYFQKAAFSGRRDRYAEDQYRSEYLSEAQLARQSDPLSCVCNYWKNRVAIEECESLRFMASMVGVSVDAIDSANLGEKFESLEADGDDAVAGENESLGKHRKDLSEKLVALLFDAEGKVSSSPYLIVVNPLGFARRIICPVSAQFKSAQANQPVYAVDADHRGGFLAVDVPAFGFAMVPASGEGRDEKRNEPAIVDGLRLRNEFFELEVDERTGGIRSIHTYRQRDNLFSQQLSLRLPPGHRTKGGLDATYAQSTVRSIKTTVDNRVVGELLIQGNLCIDDRPIADFQQTVRVARGRRVIELELEIKPNEPLTIDPWRHYYCSRFAWPNEAAELWRSVNETRCAIVESRFEAPNYIEIVDGQTRFAILTNGLPFHRRYDYRKLDSLLQVSGESGTRFRIGIGVDLPSAQQAAVEFAAKPLIWELTGRARVAQSIAWLMRVDCRNLLITAVEQLPNGVRVRLKETEGRAGSGKIECARLIAQARRIRLDGETKSELGLVDGGAEFGFSAHEYFQLELLW